MLFCWPWRGIDIFLKNRGNRIKGCWFWNKGLRHLLQTYWDSRKLHSQHASFFTFFWWQKGVAFKSSLDLYFCTLILYWIFWFAWLSSKSRKRYVSGVLKLFYQGGGKLIARRMEVGGCMVSFEQLCESNSDWFSWVIWIYIMVW